MVETAMEEQFYNQVKRWDFDRVLSDSQGRSSQTLLNEIQAGADDLFSPLRGAFEHKAPWIEETWEGGLQLGYLYHDTRNWKTPLDGGPVLQRLREDAPLEEKTFKWLFTRGNWNLTRGGYGVKSMLGFSGYEKEKLPQYRNNINSAISAISAFAPGREIDCQSFMDTLIIDNKWLARKDISIPFHLVWPALFPVHY